MNEKDAVKIITALEGKGNPTEQESFMLEDALRFLIDKNKNPRDMMYLGGIYYDQRNFDLALKYYEMAASLDYEPANECLGYVWYYGRTGEKNYEKAYKYFTNAAKRGNLVAQYKIADMYKNGYFVEKNYEKYVEIIEKLYPKVRKAQNVFDPLPEIFTRLAKIRTKEGKIKTAINLYEKAKDFLSQRIIHNSFFGNLNIMMWLIDDLYKLKEFDEENFDLYDLYYLLTMPSTVTFRYDEKTYIVSSVLEDGNIAIEFNKKWYRRREDFFAKAEIDDCLLTRLYFELYMFEVVNEGDNKN